MEKRRLGRCIEPKKNGKTTNMWVDPKKKKRKKKKQEELASCQLLGGGRDFHIHFKSAIHQEANNFFLKKGIGGFYICTFKKHVC